MRSLLLLPLAAARLLHSLPDDPSSFPKYKVEFLNHLPLENHTAQRWLATGLRGGVREFLGQPWDDSWHPPALGNGDDQVTFGVADEDVSLASHRQAWFTYSYCHNEEIRQFRELIQERPLPTGEYGRWESYTLGRAPPAPEAGADLTVAEQNACRRQSRTCAQKPREVEVQFHCSMATTDTIAFVKESRTCAYVLVIHTPRLCGEPGFMSKDIGEQASIACREVVATLPAEDTSIAATRAAKLVLPAPPAPAPGTAKDATGAGGATGKVSDIIRKALDTIKWGSPDLGDLEMLEDGEGNVVIQFIEDIPFDELDFDPAAAAAGDDARADRIVDILREAGMDLKKTGKDKDNNNKNKKKKSGNGDEKQDRRREVDDELL
ncbi:hypothetical protein B0H16DRAFT_1508104 [Mycena metata]|uniref:Protein OS-9 homolog n=1 Tax=Mycena metata TaxID=1033252 RepID=A0AAD7K2X0_9AGAR|nr:hypothetical protein B0H16DRAFT_1508104 [Mycena metata]